MNAQPMLRGATAIVVATLAMLLIGCASNATPAGELPRCIGSQTLVCYGKEATRLEDRDRLVDVEFCHCEQVVF